MNPSKDRSAVNGAVGRVGDDPPLDDDTRRGGGLTRRRALQLGAATAGAFALEVGGAQAHAGPHGGRSGRFEVSFDEDWLFYRGDASGADASSFDDSSWRKLDLPHDWEIEDLPYATSTDAAATSGPSLLNSRPSPPPASVPIVIGPFDLKNSTGGGSTAYTVQGIGWYRKHFFVPPQAGNGRHVELRFDGVYQNADVYLNGVHLGFHPYGYTSFAFDLTPNLILGRENVLAVRVNNSGQTSRWYSGSGIYRHTWLTATDAVRIPLWGVFVTTAKADPHSSVAHAEVEVTNLGSEASGASVRVSVLNDAGATVAVGSASVRSLAAGATETFEVDLAIRNARLWSPDSPSLYEAKADVIVGGRVVDSASTTFGLRSLTWGANGLLINGEPFKAAGSCTHSSHGPLGTVSLARAEEREIELLKAAGFNALRTSHNPVSPEKLAACDRLGIVVMDEFSDVWDSAKKPDDYHLYFPAWWQTDLTSMVRRDRNHPAVCLWSLGNEINDSTGGTRGQEMAALVHGLDSTRPVMQGATPFDTTNDPMYLYTDIADFHYDNPARGTGTPSSAASLHAAFPDEAITKSESWPTTVYADRQLAEQNPWFVGSWVWTGMDYLGESGIGAPIVAASNANLPVFGNGNYPWFVGFSGDLDLIGQPKPQNRWRAVVYDRSPLEVMVERPAPAGTQQYANLWSYYDELESWTWDVSNGQVMTVHVYTSGDSVTLKLNGKTVATSSLAASDQRVATFSVPYAAGTLTAIASRKGRVIASKTLATTGAPAALRLTPDVPAITTSRDDLAHILVEIVDRHGRRVADAVEQVFFQIDGAGSLAGVGSGNPQNVDSFRRPSRFTWHGQALTILRPAKVPGQVRLTATAAGLQPARVVLSVAPAGSATRNASHRHQPHRRGMRTALSAVSPGSVLLAGATAAVVRRRLANADASREAPTDTPI